MAIIKYTDAEGNVHSVNSYKINNVIVTQEKGESTADVMSQKAVTDEIKKVNSSITSETNRATTAENKIKTDLTSELNKKANSSDVYTTAQVDALTATMDAGEF